MYLWAHTLTEIPGQYFLSLNYPLLNQQGLWAPAYAFTTTSKIEKIMRSLKYCRLTTYVSLSLN
jgi:hypothetical protein